MATAVQSKRDISRVEDYLEAMYNLDQEKGFISASDISERLGVKSPTVSSMVSKLAKEGYLERERYRGMKLTDRGIKVARSVIRWHETIFELLSMFGLSKEVAYVDTEGIEHHLHPSTIQKFERLVEFLKTNPEISAKIRQSMDKD